MIPLAPGPGNLEAMSWAWLTETPALLFLFIAAVISFIASVITIWLFRPGVRQTDVQHTPVLAANPPAPTAQPATVIVVPPGNTGGAVSTFGLPVASAPVIPITNGPNMFDLTGQPAPSEVIRVSDSDFAFARD
jgi:hypothetical protein